VLIGIDKYPPDSGFLPLSCAVKDVVGIERVLVERCGFLPENIRVLAIGTTVDSRGPKLG